MKFLIKYGWIILLLGVMITACGTATPVGPIEVQMTSMAAQAQACATLQAIGTPYPCNPPTATSTPQPTSTPTKAPTATPYTGWVHYPEGGGATQMPPGFEPDCQGVVGCPWNSYTYFQDGVPQNGVPGGTQGSSGSGLRLLIKIGILAVVLFFVVVGVSAWGATAPQRALAETIRQQAKVVTAGFLPVSNMPHLSLPAPTAVKARQLAAHLDGFIKYSNAPDEFKVMLGKRLQQRWVVDEPIPMSVLAGWLTTYDRRYGSDMAKQYQVYSETHQLSLKG